MDNIAENRYNWHMNTIKTGHQKSPLTPKQRLFALEYIKDFNATQAAVRSGYSKKTAKQVGSRLLTNIDIFSDICRNMEERLNQVKVDNAYVLRRLVEVDRMDIADIFNDDFSLKPLTDWPEAWRRTLSGLDVKESMEMGEDGTPKLAILKKIRWPDKLKNLELMGKHVDVKAFAERYQHTHGVSDETVCTLRDIIAGARRKEVNHGRSSRPVPLLEQKIS